MQDSLRTVLIAICIVGGLFATAAYRDAHAERRVETLAHFMNPHNPALTPAGAALFQNYKGYQYASARGVLIVHGTVAAGTEVDDLCETFQSAHLVEVIKEIKLMGSGGMITDSDTCKY